MRNFKFTNQRSTKTHNLSKSSIKTSSTSKILSKKKGNLRKTKKERTNCLEMKFKEQTKYLNPKIQSKLYTI